MLKTSDKTKPNKKESMKMEKKEMMKAMPSKSEMKKMILGKKK